MKKKFNVRGFISLYIAISFMIISISGIILFIAPSGRIANWSNWKYLGMLKSQWQAVHTIFTFIFIVLIFIHLFYNWRPLFSYLKIKIENHARLRKEIILASLLAAFVFILTMNNTFPFKSIMNWGESIKESWANTTSEPPIPHAEELTIQKFAEVVKISKDDLLSRLTKNGISAKSDSTTIKELAVQANISPSELYRMLGVNNTIVNQSGGRGLGRKSIEQIAIENNISIDLVLKKLKEKGIKATEKETIKNLAARYNMIPSDIVGIILGKPNK